MVFSIIVIVLLAAVGVFIYKKTQKPAQVTPPAVLTRQVVQQGARIVRKPTGTAPASSVARPARTAPRRSSGSSSGYGYDSSYGNSSYFTSSYDSGSSYSSGGSSSSSCSDSSSSSSSSGGGGCD